VTPLSKQIKSNKSLQ
jgi:Leucine-rich repeat (LRR) protein